jgi:signal transduction histidine kinase
VSSLLGLRGRLTAALIAVSAVSVMLTAVLLLVPLDRRLRDDALDSLVATARTAAPSFEDLPASAVHRGSRRLDATARDLGRRTGAEVIVLDSRGGVLAATDLDPRERFSDVTRAIRERRLLSSIAPTGGDAEAQVAVPLSSGNRRYGLALRKSLDDLRAAQRVVRRALLVAALIVLTVALAGGFLLGARLIRRLAALRDTALRVAELGPVAEVRADDARDEIGDLTRAFATMQERLREQERARRTFVATASHELRTPLSSLRLMLHSAAEELDLPQPDLRDASDQTRRALRQTERLSKLAGELLDLSRLDAGIPLRAELVELGELARSVLAEFEPHIARTGASVELVAPDTRWAIADPTGAAQVLRILVDNALRHSLRTASVRVSVNIVDDRPAITVHNSGAGVAPEDADRIFERFERGAGAASDGGFGLGLAIGRELARQMGGDLRLSEQGPGACFVLLLQPAPVSIAELR